VTARLDVDSLAAIDVHVHAEVSSSGRLVTEYGVRGFKFHPNVQAFFPNDRSAYVLYEVIEELGVPAVFHTGQTGIGAGAPGGGGEDPQAQRGPAARPDAATQGGSRA
jgi:predicted TIM-barrel fold metal-dependent hydrolase